MMAAVELPLNIIQPWRSPRFLARKGIQTETLGIMVRGTLSSRKIMKSKNKEQDQ